MTKSVKREQIVIIDYLLYFERGVRTYSWTVLSY